MEAMVIGMFSVVALVVSGCCLYYKKPFWSFINSMIAMALTGWTGYSWKLMLINSGKDTTLLGFNRYPAALIILAILFLIAFISIIVSIIWTARKNKSKR